jgi:hypothetical protein
MMLVERSPGRVFGRAVATATTIGASIGAGIGALIGLFGLAAGPAALILLPGGALIGAIPGVAFGLVNGFVLLSLHASRRRQGVIALASGLTSLLCGAGLVLLVQAPLFDQQHLAGAIFAVACAIVGALAGPCAASRTP